MKQTYIAGRIRKNPNYKREFSQASDELRRRGHQTIFNPASAGMDDGRPLHEIMAYCLMRVCESDAIAMLPGWWRSGGARIEWLLAKYLGIRVIYL